MGKNWAVTIGINKYINLPSLRFAKRDANLVREYFQKEIEFEQIYHFTDDSPPIQQDHGPGLESRPTFATLHRFLRVRFEHEFLKPGDNLWFFFAGHGTRYENRDYLIPCDSDPGDVIKTALPLSYVAERLRQSGADNVILVVDACRDPSRRGLGIGEEQQQGVITLFSCSPNETSYEIEDSEVQQGAFTYTLLRGLRIQGERNCATVERLNRYLRENVPELNQRYGLPRQTPYCSVEPSEKLKLILLPHLSFERDVMALKNNAYEAEIAGHLDIAEHIWIRILTISSDDLHPAINALQRIAVRLAIASSNSTLSSGTTGTFIEDFQLDLGNGVVLEMVRIPGGSYQMGSTLTEPDRNDSESPYHVVTVSPFWMGKFSVTQAQWKAVSLRPRVNRDLSSNPSEFEGSNLPVESVTWFEAMEFCARLSEIVGQEYRLPSEAEWEFACRAGSKSLFHCGSHITQDLVNFSGTKTSEVGSFNLANDFGLFDMHGNVWEWCFDHWSESYYKTPADGSAFVIDSMDDYRIVRGGSWVNQAHLCRSAKRGKAYPHNRNDDLGFRVVCSSVAQERGK